MDNKKEKIRSSLKEDSDSVSEKQLEPAEGLLSYDDEGRGSPEVDAEEIIGNESVYLSLAGAWFASEADDREDPTMSRDEVTQVTGYGKKSVSAAILNLKDEGLVRSPSNGDYKVDYSNVSKGLKEIEQKVSADE